MSSEENKDQLRSANYDGIKEYDNNLPTWWLFTFFLTIAVAYVYWSRYFVFQTAPSQSQELEHKMKEMQAEADKKQEGKPLSNEDLLAMSKNHEIVEKGQAHFKTYCTPCHGQLGEGGIGPNLADRFWIHGWQPVSIAQVISNGVVEKGMTPWKGILSPNQIKEVTSFVMSLEGTAPPKAKAPQGEEKI